MVKKEIFKAYDIRGIFPDELDEETAYKIGRALVKFLKCKNAVIGRDMRMSSPKIFKALSDGVTDQGADVIDIGMCCTDMVYFATGTYGYGAGIMITASHNPKEYNGLKFCREQAIPLSKDTGIFDIRDLAIEGNFEDSEKGKIITKDITEDYITKVLSFSHSSRIKPLKIVVDAGNGMAGKIFPELAKKLPCKVIPLYFELDGTFPHHLANPIKPENILDLQNKVREEKADLGFAFDGDADRLFVVDENGNPVSASILTAMIAKNLLKKNPNSNILHNLVCSNIVAETITENNGTPIITPVGHSFIKKMMRDNNGLFAGEHSGHYYYRDNFYADSGMITSVIMLEILSSQEKKMSEIVKPFEKYFNSGEINSEVKDKEGKMKEIEEKFSDAERIDHLDGITIEYGDFWFNVRPSNTEPLLRLNLEADTKERMETMRDKVLKIIKEK